jgi:hypothetical protein
MIESAREDVSARCQRRDNRNKLILQSYGRNMHNEFRYWWLPWLLEEGTHEQRAAVAKLLKYNHAVSAILWWSAVLIFLAAYIMDPNGVTVGRAVAFFAFAAIYSLAVRRLKLRLGPRPEVPNEPMPPWKEDIYSFSKR